MVTKKGKAAQPTQRALGDWTSERSQVANISELARASGYNRATVVKRLEAAGVAPVRTRSKEKQFEVAAATAALSTRVESDTTGYHKARTQKTTAEAARILLKLQRERGELAPVAEFREYAYQFIKALHGRLNRYTRESRGRLFRAKSIQELERTMSVDFERIFTDLKNDFPNVF